MGVIVQTHTGLYPVSPPRLHTLNLCSYTQVCPLTVLKEHRRAFIHAALAPFEVPRMWNNRA